MNNLWFRKVFKNAAFKAKQGLVYVDPELAEEIVAKLNKQQSLLNKYNQALTNNEEFSILIINALSGTLALAARETFPNARIICIEYFPFEVAHLTKMGFEVVDLMMCTENFTLEYMNSKLQKKINKKFDVNLGNPPYQHSSKKNNKLYVDFMKLAFDLVAEDGIVALIVPDSWRTMPDIYQSMFLSKHVFVVNLEQCGTYFSDVNVLFSYFITQNTNIPNTAVEITTLSSTGNVVIQHTPLPQTLGRGEQPLMLDSIYTKTTTKPPFDVFTSYTHHTDKAGKRLTVERERDNIFNIPVLNSIATSKKNEVYIWANRHCTKQQGIPRVIISTWPAQYIQTLVSDSIETSQAFIHIRCNTLQAAIEAQKVLQKKLYRFLVKTLCPQRSLTIGLLKKLPSVDLTRSWTDEQLYQHFNLTQEEIKLIEDTIK